MMARTAPNPAKRGGGHLGAAERPCREPGCLDPRYVSPRGYVDTRCRIHEAEDSRERYLAKRPERIPYVRRTGPKAERPCLGPVSGAEPCDQPRRVGPTGKVDGRCREHAAAAQLQWHRSPTHGGPNRRSLTRRGPDG